MGYCVNGVSFQSVWPSGANLQAGRWEYVQPMKTLRRGIAVGVLGGPMYAVGK